MANGRDWTRAQRQALSQRARQMDADQRMGTSIRRAAESGRGRPPTAAQLRHIARLRARLGAGPSERPATRRGATAEIALLEARAATAPPLVASSSRAGAPDTRGTTTIPTDPSVPALTAPCPRQSCRAQAGQPCTDRSGRPKAPHAARIRAVAAPQ